MNIFKFNTNHKASTSIQDDIKAARAMRNALQPSRTDVIKTQELNSKNLEILLGLSKDFQVMSDGTQPDMLKQIATLRNDINTLNSKLNNVCELLEDVITRPNNAQKIKPASVKPTNSQLFVDDSTRPPKPELTGDVKRLWWMLNKIQNRLSYNDTFSHIRRRYYNVYEKRFVTLETLRDFIKSRNSKWSNDYQKWGVVIGQEKCAKALPFAYELLTSTEQYKYDEMFGKPKDIK